MFLKLSFSSHSFNIVKMAGLNIVNIFLHYIVSEIFRIRITFNI